MGGTCSNMGTNHAPPMNQSEIFDNVLIILAISWDRTFPKTGAGR